ncbi:MAG: 30S ribosomal protein S1 [Planctomycetaceae bacterium]|nr:30S ribosomal protein S1 [Planctomycetaceae bacterium]
MVDRQLEREFAIGDEELDLQIEGGLEGLDVSSSSEMDQIYEERAETYEINEIVEGTVVRIDDDEVVVDIGYKSEGIVQRDEWENDDELPEVGDKIEVLLEEFEDELGIILLSKRKADRQREWEKIISTHAEGDEVVGEVTRKIKGGLLVNIGVPVFLPASQVDIRRPPDIGDYIGQEIECVILKIDESRRNIVVSRRKLIEEARNKLKAKLLDEIKEGDLRKGVVKNIADFGAFVDLGGLDGLLHITDMSWKRIDHPSQVVKIDEEIEVKILNIDRVKEKIALGLKQKFPSPWDNVETKYPVGSTVKGEVVNVMSYGAFVKLEDGIEGLVHISEMSWTKRINHPSEMVNVGDEVEVVVLNIDTDKKEISLGMKQTQPNPWDEVAEKYPPDSKVKGTVRNLTNYGAFIELEEGVDGLLHVSDMSWTRKISHANEMLKKGDEIECLVISVDEDRKRIALGLKQMDEDPWETRIPEKYQPGTIVKGTVTKITNFGVFVELEEELEGLLHVSELGTDEVENPEEIVNVGEEIEVRILRVDTAERKIGLSLKLDATPEEIAAQAAGEPTSGAPREELKGGTGGGAGPLFSMPQAESESEEEADSSENQETPDDSGEGNIDNEDEEEPASE